jgi:lipopolysaccharide/colanic/teichoic acid biosynthesis glycosyltransferase
VIRFLDIFLSLFGLILLFPLFLLVIILIKISSRGNVIYKQIRVGLGGSDFHIYKFRTMYVDADKAGLLTVGGRDPRVTTVGYYLRKYKIDELPQLFNVLRGNMSLVGPRPEVRKYVDKYTSDQRRVLSVKPGITDWASILYRDENSILESSKNPEQDYLHVILPDKIRYNSIYINKLSVFEYIKILLYTVYSIFFPVKNINF